MIPTDVTIRDAMLARSRPVRWWASTTRVDGQLVYLGDDGTSICIERYTLAHELTHAIDDQHFDLSRLDTIAAACRDEAFQAALGAVEGSAEFFATQVLTRFPDPDAGTAGDLGGAGPPAGRTALHHELTCGPTPRVWVHERAGRGRRAHEVDGALSDLPPTTEQVMHPELYPDDRPRDVGIADRSPALGPAAGATWT